MSEKRKNLLVLLEDGPKEMEMILRSLKTSRQALLPQIRILEEHHLIVKSDDTYELTTIGRLILNDMVPLLKTCQLFDVDINYWGTHNFDFIPNHLLRRINELEKCRTVSPPITEIYELVAEFHQGSKKSRSVFAITTFLHPNFTTLFSELMSNNTNIYMIISRELFSKLQTDYQGNLPDVFQNKLFYLYVYPKEMSFLSLIFNDFDILISPLKRGGGFDNKYIMCSSKSALEWGKDLFDCFLKDSDPLTNV
ncbi:winged helix-turn-helix domain-containing protein [Methanolobus sp. ZRKC2]|uniref:helix-turn-helix transcriptional regulator n=1 Tax=Methanolobus sp. ZRKC2 TaxID=3125783 RepID=UPI003246A901